MSLLPLYLNNNWHAMRPSRIINQHFGMGLNVDDLYSPPTPTHGPPPPSDLRSMMGQPAAYISCYRPWRFGAAKNDTGSTVIADNDKFQVNLDVQHFTPEEITIKATGNNTITVAGKHEEKQDEHGFISRHFVRRYVIPDGHDINNAVSNLSSDGVLSIMAPRVVQANDEHRTIPIQQTGVPIKAVKVKGVKGQGNQAQKKD